MCVDFIYVCVLHFIVLLWYLQMASSESIQPFACRCSLRKCIQGDLEVGMARVEVRSVTIPTEEREHMEVGKQLSCCKQIHEHLVL